MALARAASAEFAMRVILLRDVPSLGRAGEVKTVADGYGRNYLLPRKLAHEATPAQMRASEEQARTHAQHAAREHQEMAAIAAGLEEKTVTVHAKAGATGRLFGAVTAQDLAQAISQQLGLPLERRQVELKAPLKALGEHQVQLRLDRDLVAKIKVVVQALPAEPGKPVKGGEA
jgi:large subunit ribosomal protein L9